jgi:hypothetical protein
MIGQSGQHPVGLDPFKHWPLQERFQQPSPRGKGDAKNYVLKLRILGGE